MHFHNREKIKNDALIISEEGVQRKKGGGIKIKIKMNMRNLVEREGFKCPSLKFFNVCRFNKKLTCVFRPGLQ